MAGPCFTLYYEKSNNAPIESVQIKLNNLTTERQMLQKYNWISPIEEGWELFLDGSVISNSSSKKQKNMDSTGMILLTYSSHVEFEHINNTEKTSLNNNLGFVPKWSWTGCAMCKNKIDIDGLFFLLDLLVNEFGGYQKLSKIDSKVIESNPNCIHEIEFRDFDSYFGNREVSNEEKRQYEKYVPLISYHMIDLSKTSYRKLDY